MGPGPAPPPRESSSPRQTAEGAEGAAGAAKPSALTHAPGIPREPAPSATPPPWAGPCPRGQGEAGSPTGRGGRRPPPPHGAAPPGSSTCCGLAALRAPPTTRLSPSCLDLPLCLACFFHRRRVGQGSLHPCVVNPWWGEGRAPSTLEETQGPSHEPPPRCFGSAHTCVHGHQVCVVCALCCVRVRACECVLVWLLAWCTPVSMRHSTLTHTHAGHFHGELCECTGRSQVPAPGDIGPQVCAAPLLALVSPHQGMVCHLGVPACVVGPAPG